MKLLALLFLTFGLQAEEYQIFDGQTYNNLYYPRIDVIEWGEPLHLEFHVYQKDKPIDVYGYVIEKGGKKLFSFAYDLTYRGERRCRRVPAPPHWKVGQKLHFYSDKSDEDMNRIIVSAETMKEKAYTPKSFDNCVEVAAFSAREKETEVAKQPEMPVNPDLKKDAPEDKRQVASEEKGEKKTDNQEDGEKSAEAAKSPDSYSSDLGGDYNWFSE